MEMQSGMEPDDRLSALPDDILLHVVKDLDLHAVVRLSALSRRWRHVPRLLSDLTIDVADLLPRDYGDEDDGGGGQRHREIMLAYADAARKLLAPSAERSIKSLRLRFFLAEQSCRLLGDILEEAGVVGTERLELDVRSMKTTTTAFGCGAASSSRLLEHKNVSRQRFMSFFTACPVAFGCLTSLSLDNLRFRAWDVPRILGGCPRLQWLRELLSLSHCSCRRGRKAAAPGLAVLQIDAPRSRLAALEVRFCWFLRVDVIRAPELRRVLCDTWYGDSPPLRFGHVPRLRTLTLACNAREFLLLNDPLELAEFMPESVTDWSLSTLHLDLRDRMICVVLPDPDLTQLSSTFSDLRDVYLYNISQECNLNWTLFVLEAAASLKNLYITIYRHVCNSADSAPCFKTEYLPWTTWTPSSDFKHHNLQLLEIVGYAVERKLGAYIRLVMECAVCLKRVRLLEHEPCVECAS